MKNHATPRRQDEQTKPFTWTSRAWLGLAVLCGMQPLPAPAQGSMQPSSEQMLTFQQYTSCPADGRRSGGCPGYRIVFKVPPCAGGQNRWTNMVWLSDAAARNKLRNDSVACAGSASSGLYPRGSR